MPALRSYQSEDVQSVIDAHDTHAAVLGRAATGLGKAVELAAIAQHYAKAGRVLVLVDVGKLVSQLADTIRWFTGVMPGIEMAENRAVNRSFLCEPDRIIVGTIQSQYAGAEGYERFRQFDPTDFSALLLDETETFLAPKALSVVKYYMGNPALRVYGCSATPFRTDGTAMAELFNHVAFNRDIAWGIDEAWLVPVRQAFVRVSIDFSTLKVRKNDEGERDYADAEIAEKLNEEQVLIELAKGICVAAEDRRSIVVAPDIATAKAIADYLNGERAGCAKCVYGELGAQEKTDLMDQHQRGEFQFLTSCMMLTKGYDDPQIRAVFNCRKTRSKRLYTQILGRGTRPLKGLVEELATPAERSAAIGASAKPDCLMVNMVGVDDSTRDMTVIDILGERHGQDAVHRAKKKMLAEKDEPSFDVDEVAKRAIADREAEEQRRRDEEAARLRRKISVDAEVNIEHHDDLGISGGGSIDPRIPFKQRNIFSKAKIPPADLAKLTPEAASQLSREIVRRWKMKLCSYKQAKLLKQHGYTKGELHDMSFATASAAINEIASNGWQRPIPAHLIGATFGEI